MIETHQIAHVAHEANRALQIEQQDRTIPVSPPWDDLDNETQMSVINGVVEIMSGQVTSPEQSHAAWCEFKRQHGWTHGPVKDADAKTHPLLVDWEYLPVEQQAKDRLFYAIVHVLNPHLQPVAQTVGPSGIASGEQVSNV